MSCNNKIFCAAPWVSMFVKPRGEVFPCRWFLYTKHIGNIYTDSLESMYNSDLLKKLRLEILHGIVTDECNSCIEFEKNIDTTYVKSQRQEINSVYSNYEYYKEITEDDGSVKFDGIDCVELSTSMLCDFKCVTCNPYDSSEWVIDANLLADGKRSYSTQYPYGIGGHSIAKTDKNKLVNQLDKMVETVNQISLSGGEPLLSAETLHVIDKLIELKKTDINLIINTNLSNFYKIGNFVDKLKLFDHLQLKISIDGSWKRGEYIRKGLNYSQWIDDMSNIQRDFPGKYNFVCTVSMFNIWHVPDFVDEMIELGLLCDTYIEMRQLVWPYHQSYQILPNEFKHDVYDKYTNSIDKLCNESPNTVKYLEHIRDQLFAKDMYDKWSDRFLCEARRLDAIRDTNFLEVCPELTVMLL